MEQLKQRILAEGVIMTNEVLKLDGILNHQVDPQLIMQIGRQFALLFASEKPTKVLTIESSGITVAFATALELKVPMVFARRKKTLTTDDDSYCERVPSFTKGIVTDIMVSKAFISKEDRILFIDDIIANGDAARGIIRIIERSGADLVGFGVVVEKTFQAGARTIRDLGVRVDSIVKISSLDNGIIAFE
ncbi:xanthine phosphoribosyltransferase [Paenibacillus psychroresistens]|uniref:Xanthine phosphoribosyltransferase n=1 Tax=Paenibacillus psychroresistens TaxID=1778678 RepID=A0A6B8RPB3_9BACL|nr:xanthine phosphoribosyltransferase [Paenibacillus psychroresistens]QGQ97395.1 xanthine phosphoribosyltransferase [Paenibacillus psychroresistens]